MIKAVITIWDETDGKLDGMREMTTPDFQYTELGKPFQGYGFQGDNLQEEFEKEVAKRAKKVIDAFQEIYTFNKDYGFLATFPKDYPKRCISLLSERSIKEINSIIEDDSKLGNQLLPKISYRNHLSNYIDLIELLKTNSINLYPLTFIRINSYLESQGITLNIKTLYEEFI